MSDKATTRPAGSSAATRRPANAPPGRRSAAGGAALRSGVQGGEDYFTPGWGLLFAAFVTITLIFFLFTPYTHQLDEIKNVLLMSIPAVLLAGTYYLKFYKGSPGEIWILSAFGVALVSGLLLSGWLASAMFGLSVAALLIGVATGNQPSGMSWRTHAPTFLLGLYTLVMVISYLINPYKPIGERVVWFQAGTSAFTVLFAWFMNSEAKLRKTMMFFVLLALASTILGLVLVAGQGFTDLIYNAMKDSAYWRDPDRSPWVTLFYTLKENKEMYSSVLNSDFYAAFLVMTLPIPLSMFFVENHLLHKSLALAAFLLMNVCLFLTNSNDSFMSIIVTYLVYLVLGILYVRGRRSVTAAEANTGTAGASDEKGWGLSRRFIITFLAGSFVLGATMIALMLPTLARTWDFKSEAISGRNILWEGGFWPWLYFDDPTHKGQLVFSAIDWSSFFFGTGPGGYRFYFPVFRNPTFFDNQINNVTTFGHNLYLDVLMETGLLGLLAFLGFYGSVLWTGFQQIRRTENSVHRFYQMALVSGLTGIIIQNYFSPNYRWAVCGVILWALFGLSMGLTQLDTPPAMPADPQERRKKLPWPLLAKGALGLFALTFLFRSPDQAIHYWKGAVANGLGLRNLDYADQTKGTAYEDDFLQKAAANFEEAIRQNPTFVTSYYKLAHVYNNLGHMDKATKVYENLQATNPNYSEIHQNLAIMYEAASRELDGEEQIKKMEQAYAEALLGSQQSWKPSMLWLTGTIGEELAAYYLAAGQDEKAIKVYNEIKHHYRTLIEYQPKLPRESADRQNLYPRAQAKLVQLAQVTGNPEEAEPVLQAMYRENPDRPEYLQRLLAYYDKYEKPAEKIAFLEAAVHDDPLNVELRRKLADAYSRTGNETAYQKELRRIEVLTPADTEIQKALYASYNKSGQDQKAAAYRQKLSAAGVNPDGETTGTATGEPATTGTAAAAVPTTATATAVTTSPAVATATPVPISAASPVTSPAAAATTTP